MNMGKSKYYHSVGVFLPSVPCRLQLGQRHSTGGFGSWLLFSVLWLLVLCFLQNRGKPSSARSYGGVKALSCWVRIEQLVNTAFVWRITYLHIDSHPARETCPLSFVCTIPRGKLFPHSVGQAGGMQVENTSSNSASFRTPSSSLSHLWNNSVKKL